MHLKSLATITLFGFLLCACGDDGGGSTPGTGGASATSSSVSAGDAVSSSIASTTEYCYGDPDVSAACAVDHPEQPEGWYCAPNASPFGMGIYCVDGRNQI
jgi:hypothetical protein